MKKISKMSTGYLRTLRRKLFTEKERVENEDRQIQGGSSTWPCNGDGSPITRTTPTLPIHLLPEIEFELDNRENEIFFRKRSL